MNNAATASRPAGRIGIIGVGGIGGFYGIMLARAGFDVHFLLRSEYDAVARDGLLLKSARFGDTRLHPVQAYRDAADMPQCDWVLVAAKTTANAGLAPAIARVAAPGAKVMLFQNGFGVEDELRKLLPESLHLIGGLCIISVHREGPGVIGHHDYGSVNLGYHSGPGDNGRMVLEQAGELFRVAGIDAPLMDDLIQARWQKLVMNIPFNGVSVLLDSGTRALMSYPTTRALIRELMEEVIDAAATCGHSLGEGYIDKAWSATDGKPDYTPSMLLDYKERRPLELQAIYAAPLAAAAAAGKPMRKVEMLYQSLCFIDQRNRS
ncbi:putative 2-dehydropantoate 2-reductase [Massilia niastensis]|uniref:putative 2-dehydropantoate 2-reductase n=1 Tax=Massilia niastensis TaxID=544911 RepID=UPI000373567F|nr:putative 2-dehydropantoate 2-reductase [Massilia niastensis]